MRILGTGLPRAFDRFCRVTVLAGSLVAALLSITPSAGQTIIDSAQDCLAHNQQANDSHGAMGAVACFNRSMTAIARRKAEIEAVVRVVDRCRGTMAQKQSEPFSCRIATEAGVTNRQPILVKGGQCKSNWNEFAHSIYRVLNLGCRTLAGSGAAQFDQDGKLIIQMTGPDNRFLDSVSQFLDEKIQSETHFGKFNRCFYSCGVRQAPEIFKRYGVRDYKDLSVRYAQLLRVYRKEGLEQKFANLANTCNRVSRRWWTGVSRNFQAQLVCKTPAINRQ